jgi:hypothetical protein
VPSVNEPGQWFLNLGSERDWNFRAEPSSHLNGRAPIVLLLGPTQTDRKKFRVGACVTNALSEYDGAELYER